MCVTVCTSHSFSHTHAHTYIDAHNKHDHTCSRSFFFFSKLQMEMVHTIVRGWSRPMLGRSCSLTPSSPLFPDPSVLSALPPVTSSFSCYPVWKTAFSYVSSAQIMGNTFMFQNENKHFTKHITPNAFINENGML